VTNEAIFKFISFFLANQQQQAVDLIFSKQKHMEISRNGCAKPKHTTCQFLYFSVSIIDQVNVQ